jgi:hypothetical protein
MAIIILAGTFGGIKLDDMMQNKFPVFTVVLSLLAVLFSMYIAVKDLLTRKK